MKIGRLLHNHTSGGLTFDNVLSSFDTGDGDICQIAGVTDLTADSPDYPGIIEVLGSTLKVYGDLSSADGAVSSGGTLGGSGSVDDLTWSERNQPVRTIWANLTTLLRSVF